MNISFLEVDREDQPLIEERFPDAFVSQHAFTPDEVIKRCQDAEVICVFIYTKMTKEVIEGLPNLKLICTRSVGYDHIDLDACREKDVRICNVPDYGSHVISEHVFALLLSAARHIIQADKQVEQGEFDYKGLRGMALKGKTIGIVGTGKIGRRTAKIAYGFGMKILAVDRCRVLKLEEALEVQYVSMDELLSKSDVITLHVPHTEETQHMINTEAFLKMKDGVTLINTARGELIDSTALLEALESGKVKSALLDVLEHEKNFKENEKLIEHPNVITTPHIAFFTEDSMHNMFTDAFDSIDQWIDKKPLEHEVVDVEKICDLPGVSS